MTTYSDYDPFARVYNKHWGNSFTQYALRVLEMLVLPNLPAEARILDLCCGTGQLARILSERGYRVTGLDGSAEMLRFARENAPGVEFIHDDARTFRLPPVYHAVISAFDSLNHVMTLEELTFVFRNVYAALREGGLFLFDLNMEAGYRTTWNDNFGIVEDDMVCVVRSGYLAEERTARFDATIFRRRQNWERSDITLFQKCYTEGEVRSALESAGLSEIHACSYNLHLDLRPLTEDAERAFFLCEKSVNASSDNQIE
jgi:SAM-dependent methyltransferase